jgi:hypothetical protein
MDPFLLQDSKAIQAKPVFMAADKLLSSQKKNPG